MHATWNIAIRGWRLFTEQERLALLKVIFEHQFDYDDDMEALKSAQEKLERGLPRAPLASFLRRRFDWQSPMGE